jgi:hypothetical protein
MSHFDVQAFYTRNYAPSNTADWDGMYARGDWPSVMYRPPAVPTPFEHAVRQMARALEPGGVLVPNIVYLKRRIELLLGGYLTVLARKKGKRS